VRLAEPKDWLPPRQDLGFLVTAPPPEALSGKNLPDGRPLEGEIMIRFIPLGGFLGAGKTTTMLAAAKILESRGERVSLVTNDQGSDLVDTQLAKESGLAGIGEVTGGCFCCRFDDLAEVVIRLTEQVNPTIVIAEAVGSCTDLQSTVVKPLRRLYGDALRTGPLTVTVDPVRLRALDTLTKRLGVEPDLAYLFRHQLDEADIIGVNKIDLLSAPVLSALTDDLSARFPHARIVTYSAATGTSLNELIASWGTAVSEHDAFDIDYDRYAHAEAELAWTNQTFTLTGRGFSALEWAKVLLEHLGAAIDAEDAAIGHIKLRVAAADGAVKASLTQAGAAPTFDQHHGGPLSEATVTFNARVQLGTAELDAMITAAVAAADAACATASGPRTGDIFHPSYPTPVHRM